MKMHDSSKNLRCHYEGCKAAFNRPYRLQQHLLIHENVKAFPCPKNSCKKAYTSKSHLDRHINSVHEPSQETIIYSCPKCLMKFANKQNIKRHMKAAHTETKVAFSCAECHAEFRKKHRLNSHMFTHTGIKAFSCTKCSESFVTLQEKKRHIKFHKTYTCEDCYLVFDHWSAYQKHKRVENAIKEYICDHCQRKFKQRQHILHHMKTHYVPNPVVKIFLCHYENCNRKYTRKSNLKQHIKMKHEKVTYDCTICDAKLSTKAKLSSHMKMHERTEPVVTRPKTKVTGRKERKDKNTAKSSVIFKIADFIPRETQLMELETSC